MGDLGSMEVEVLADISQYLAALKGAGGSSDEFAAKVKTALGGVGKSFDDLQKRSFTARYTVQNLGDSIRDIPFAAANPAILTTRLEHLADSFSTLKMESGSTKAALGQLAQSLAGGGGLMIAFNVLAVAAGYFFKSILDGNDKIDSAKKALADYKSEVEGVFSDAGKEAGEVLGLITVLNSEIETRKRKNDALKELQKINPEIFGQLKLEGGAVAGLDLAYQSYIANLKTVISAKVLQLQLEDKVTKLLKLQGIEQSSLAKSLQEGFKKNAQEAAAGGAAASLNFLTNQTQKTTKETNNLNREIDDLTRKLGEVSKGVKIPVVKDKLPKKVSEGKQDDPFAVSLADLEDNYKDALALVQGYKYLELIETEKFLKLKLALLQKYGKYEGEVNLEIAKNNLKLYEKEKGQQNIEKPELTGGKEKIDPLGGLYNLNGGKGNFQILLAQQEAIRKSLEQTAALATDVLSPAFDAFFNTIINGGANAFKSFGDALASVLKQLAATLLKTVILKAIMTAITGKSVPIPGLDGSGIIPGHATGVNNTRGGLAMVGEWGPELVRLPQGADVVPNRALSDMAGNSNQGVPYLLNTVIQGSDLRVLLQRADARYSRNT